MKLLLITALAIALAGCGHKVYISKWGELPVCSKCGKSYMHRRVHNQRRNDWDTNRNCFLNEVARCDCGAPIIREANQ